MLFPKRDMRSTLTQSVILKLNLCNKTTVKRYNKQIYVSKIENGCLLGLEKFVLENFKESESLALRNPISYSTNELMKIFKFSIFSRGNGLYEMQKTVARAYYHGSLSTSFPEEKPSK